MLAVAKMVISVFLTAATIGLTYVLLSPAVWPRETFEWFGPAAAMALGSDLAYEVSAARSKAPDRVSLGWWFVYTIAESVTLAAGCLVFSVLLSEAGPRASLSTGSQQLVFAMSCVLVAAVVVWFSVHTKEVRRREDSERDARLAEAGNLARQNVREFVDGLKVEESSGQDDPHHP